MSTITTKDGTEIYYKDWGAGPTITFSHGWPLSSDAWDGQMMFLAQHGYRCIDRELPLQPARDLLRRPLEHELLRARHGAPGDKALGAMPAARRAYQPRWG